VDREARLREAKSLVERLEVLSLDYESSRLAARLLTCIVGVNPWALLMCLPPSSG